MAVESVRLRAARLFTQRCGYLFFSLLLMLLLAPSIADSGVQGRVLSNVINVIVLMAAVAAMGRSNWSFVVASLLAVPVLGYQVAGLTFDEPRYLAISWGFGAAFYATTLVYLMGYVFRDEVMTSDKLFGAASAYLMIGILWAYLMSVQEYLHPNSYAINGVPAAAGYLDFLFLSFSMLTSNGFSSLVPVLPGAKSLVLVEQVAGVLFVAILIARLAGIYPPQKKRR